MALACDLRIAKSSAYFVVGFGGIALAPDSGVSLFLPVYIGLGRAQEYFYSNKPITAQQAMEWGMVNQVGDADFQITGDEGCGQSGLRSDWRVCAGEEGFQSRHPAQSRRSRSTTKAFCRMRRGNRPNIVKVWRLFWESERQSLSSSAYAYFDEFVNSRRKTSHSVRNNRIYVILTCILLFV